MNDAIDSARDFGELGLPPLFIKRLQQIVPERHQQSVFASFTGNRQVAFRVNSLRADFDEVLSELNQDGITAKPVAQLPNAAWVTTSQRDQLTHHSLAESGKIYIQGLSSHLASLVLAPQPGEMVMDLAAAPGGKSSHLAALMNNLGALSAVEPIRNRFFRMQANLRRLGVAIAKFYMLDGRQVGKKVGPRFDRIMLDAPCTSESRFIAGQTDTFDKWSERKIRECSRKQAGLIVSAFDSLKPGGTLLYCTCTFAPEENEAIVAHLLERYPQQALVEPIPILDSLPCQIQTGLLEFSGRKFPAEIESTYRILPDQQFSGFYFAKLRKHP